MGIVGHGRILLWEGASLWLFSVAKDRDRTDFHAHHAIQITLALDGAFDLHTRAESQSGPCVAISADTEHLFEASGDIAFLFIEPDSAVGRTLKHSWFEQSPLRPLPLDRFRPYIDALAQALRDRAGDDALIAIGKRMVAELEQGTPSAELDFRVQRMIDYVSANLGCAPKLVEAADRACLSPDRASHLFVERTGLPFRTYVLWRRLAWAVEHFSNGASLTEAAHASGFADSAHLSRTFRRMFGLPAASLQLMKAAPQ